MKQLPKLLWRGTRRFPRLAVLVVGFSTVTGARPLLEAREAAGRSDVQKAYLSGEARDENASSGEDDYSTHSTSYITTTSSYTTTSTGWSTTSSSSSSSSGSSSSSSSGGGGSSSGCGSYSSFAAFSSSWWGSSSSCSSSSSWRPGLRVASGGSAFVIDTGSKECGPTACKNTIVRKQDNYEGAPTGFHYVDSYVCGYANCTMKQTLLGVVADGAEVSGTIGGKTKWIIKKVFHIDKKSDCQYYHIGETQCGTVTNHVLVPN